MLLKLLTVILSFLQLLQLLLWSDTTVFLFKCSLTLSISGLEVDPIYWMLLSLDCANSYNDNHF